MNAILDKRIVLPKELALGNEGVHEFSLSELVLWQPEYYYCDRVQAQGRLIKTALDYQHRQMAWGRGLEFITMLQERGLRLLGRSWLKFCQRNLNESFLPYRGYEDIFFCFAGELIQCPGYAYTSYSLGLSAGGKITGASLPLLPRREWQSPTQVIPSFTWSDPGMVYTFKPAEIDRSCQFVCVRLG